MNYWCPITYKLTYNMQICAKLTHKVPAGYKRASQSAPILNLTWEMNFVCPINYKIDQLEKCVVNDQKCNSWLLACQSDSLN